MPKATRIPALDSRTRLAVAGPLLLEARIADVRRYEASFAGDAAPEADAVHDMRVAARRLRAALALFGGRRARALEPQVKALQDALGAVRDAQVHREWLSGRPGRHVPELARRLEEDLHVAEKKLRAALRAWTTAVAPTLERASLAAGGRGTLGGRPVRKELRAAEARLERRLGTVGDALLPRTGHRIRIAAKKLRYLAELAAPGRPRRTRRVLRVLEPFLDRLGALHDTDVRLARLADLARTGAPPGERDVARAMVGRLSAERSRIAGALLAEIEELRREGLSRRRGHRRVARAAVGRDPFPALAPAPAASPS